MGVYTCGYIKEKEIKNNISIGLDQLVIIKEKMEKSTCKIKCPKEGYGTGFFCKIPFPDQFNLLPVLITNNHVLDKNDIKIGNKFRFSLNNDKSHFYIFCDKERKTYTNIDYDITIIELKPKESEFLFLEIDEKFFLKNPNDFYKDLSIYLMHYPNGKKVELSDGKIQGMYEDNFTFEHSCTTQRGSSGGPIINLLNHKVLGLHKGYKKLKTYNLGTLLSIPIQKFNEKYNKNIINKNIGDNQIKINDLNNNHLIDDLNLINNNIENNVKINNNENMNKMKNERKINAEKRIQKEYYDLSLNPITDIGCSIGFPDKNNIFQWKFTMIGPKNTSYAGGLFYLIIKFPDDFPESAPDIYYKTPIYHINVNPKNTKYNNKDNLGHVCLSSLLLWKPENSMREILTNLFDLFYHPDNHYDRYILDRADEFLNNRDLYEEKIKYFTIKYANLVEVGKEYNDDWDFSYKKNEI